MKRKRMLALLLVYIMIFTSCVTGSTDTFASSKKVSKLTLNYSKAGISVGESLSLTVKSVKPSKASKTVTWKSSNKKIVAVSAKGKVKAKKAGTVTITATSKSNPKVTAKCKVKIYKATKTLKLESDTSYTIAIGKTVTLKATVTKPKKGAQPIQWSSGNKAIAKVDAKGKVTAVSAGQTNITGKSGKKKVSVKIKVEKPTDQPADQPQDTIDPEPTPQPVPQPEPDSAGHSGTYCGMNWTIDANGKLVIAGEYTGLEDYGDIHWYVFRDEIISAVIMAKNVRDTNHWFYCCKNLQTIDMSNFDTSQVTDMSWMFSGCSALRSIEVPLNCKESIPLPNGTWQDASGTTYTFLPDVTTSFRITLVE